MFQEAVTVWQFWKALDEYFMAWQATGLERTETMCRFRDGLYGETKVWWAS